MNVSSFLMSSSLKGMGRLATRVGFCARIRIRVCRSGSFHLEAHGREVASPYIIRNVYIMVYIFVGVVRVCLLLFFADLGKAVMLGSQSHIY